MVSCVGWTGSFVTVLSGVVCRLDRQLCYCVKWCRVSVGPSALLLCLVVSCVGWTGSFVTVFSGGAGAAFLGVNAYAPWIKRMCGN